MRCARDTMRGPMRCELVAMQFAVRGLVAGGAMLLTEGFLGWDGWPEGWVDRWSV